MRFAVVNAEDYGGNAQQVKQVDANRKPDDVGNRNQVAVGLWLLGAIFPFEHQPEG